MKKNEFEALSTIVFVRGSDKRKYGGLKTINIQKRFRKQWTLYVKGNLNQKIIKIKLTHKNRIKMEVVSNINQIKQVSHKQINMKKIYCCGLGTHILNNYEIRYKIASDQ